MVIVLGYRAVVKMVWSTEMGKRKKKSVVQNIILSNVLHPWSPQTSSPQQCKILKKWADVRTWRHLSWMKWNRRSVFT